ncbi:FadR/GntR family transcriptional regulator [Gelria sp. Kuro-4]|uniref:FadR/GntR family transcriptional regulator n=1 Tax=Gelria sp. Kuro-4 TaxID=2796927 RepID=UPI001BEF6C04|nr:FadR/GntR family transcriptional regulator [Gelria sp. Kuro-4]BCV23239.1 GntR family transcriptional regulator [Gelria sp. Kuro-4]
MLRPVQKRTVAEEIIDQIKGLVREGTLKPGDRLPAERELAEQLSVSRASVREAVRALSLMGLVAVRPGEGTFLNEDVGTVFRGSVSAKLLMKKSQIIELCEARRLLEVALVRLAAKRATSDDLTDLRHCLFRMEQSLGTHQVFIREDYAFHLMVAKAAKNDIMADVLETVRDLLMEVQRKVVAVAGAPQRSFQFHKAVYEALVRQDGEGAAAAMEKHLQDVQEVVLAVYERSETGRTD